MNVSMSFTRMFSSSISNSLMNCVRLRQNCIFRASPAKDKNENSEYYDQDMLFLGNYSGIIFPVIFKQSEYGKKFQDVLDTG